MKKAKICYLKIPYFLSIRIENRNQFLIIKYVFDIFCSREQKIVPQRGPKFSEDLAKHQKQSIK